MGVGAAACGSAGTQGLSRSARGQFCCRAAGAALGWLPHSTDRLVAEFMVIGFAGAALLLARPYSARIASHWLWRPIAALGTISYSLYLIHQFNIAITNAVSDRLVGAAAPDWLHISVAVSAQVGLATAFWYVCERPFMGAEPRQPRAPRVTAGDRDPTLESPVILAQESRPNL